MKEERRNLLIALAVMVFVLLAYILSDIFLKPQIEKPGTEGREPVNRLEKIREGFTEK